MIAPNLPAELKAALEAKLEGVSRGDASRRAAAISEIYRAGGGSGAIKTAADALAYVLARMPATYGAVAASLNALSRIRPVFSPQSLFDIGAGPGTATFAAAEAFSSLKRFALFDRNDAVRSLALEFARENTRLAEMRYMSGEALCVLAQAQTADLVVASYVIGELAEAERSKLVSLMWAKTSDTLLIIEPGTPAGYDRIIAARQHLIALGAYIAVPCPHDGPCPLSAPDWCHFAQRLPRSRAHKLVKGVELPFEDEKFSYVALTRDPVGQRHARVLAQPAVGKVEVSAKLCTVDGLMFVKVPRRDREAYARARRWHWGDAVMKEG
ncbi:MAG: SAM-dependent methyltransferase [Bradyrhizobium sp.]|nr:SAM-dependent methyltransferase [Bradyrhizobium sp.]